MYIFKSPNIGGGVTPHQDGTFLYTEPQSVLGFWWALDDCTQENGCLWAIPGSHEIGVHRKFQRLPYPEIGTEFVPKEEIKYSTENGVPVECAAGALVLIHHSVIHWSAPNTSQHQRHAYTIHVVDSPEYAHYPKENWLQRSDNTPFSKILS
jgi:phytanoyl-CoA hydroxylase